MSKIKKRKFSLKCVVHYPDQKCYSTIKELLHVNKERIIKAKEKRLEQGVHYDQCSEIPDTFEEGVHGIHLEPCYKR